MSGRLLNNLVITLFALGLSLNGVAQISESWHWVSPAPQGNYLYTSQLLGDGTAYMAGRYGTVLKSNDFGASWTVMESIPEGDVKSLFFVNADTGFAVAQNINKSFLYKTINGGAHWDSTGFPDKWLNVIWFLDDTTGFVGGDFGSIMKTTDGGNSWLNIPYSPNTSFFRFSALNGQEIYASTRFDVILKSSDGGFTWNKMIDGVDDAPFVHFFDQQTGIFAGAYDSFIYKTYNGGATWWPKNNQDVYATSMTFFDQANGIIAGLNGNIWKTADQGETWQLIPAAKPFYFLTSSFINMQQGILGGVNGQMAFTADSGLTLTPTSTRISGDNLMGMFFLNDSTGFVGSEHGKIYTTSNRWKTFDSLSIPFDADVYILDFPTAQTGYALTWWNEFRVYKTTNGGNTWQHLSSLTGDMYEMKFFDENTGIITTGNGIKRTSDGGMSWSFYPTSSEFTIDLMSFVNPTIGYVSGYNQGNEGVVYNTTDGGQNWQMMTFPLPRFHTLKAISANTIYAATLHGILYRSMDGGVTWTDHNAITEAGLSYVHLMDFSDSLHGFCAGSSGSGDVVAETTDGGLTWTIQLFAEHYLGGDIAILPVTDTYYVTGQLGTMLRKQGSTVLATPKNSNPRQTISIYPNPANTHLTLDIAYKTNNPAQFAIYNLVGNIVLEGTITDYPRQTLNINDLKPGLYLIKIFNKDISKVMKFIKSR